MVKHIEKQSSDHYMLILDTKPEMEIKRKRFYFDKRWISKHGVEKVVRKAWEPECLGFSMFKVAYKIKRCKMELIKWNRQ